MGYVMHGSKGWWVSVGKQQWGFSANPVTYPIAFNEKTLLVCGLTFDQQSTHSPNLYQNLTTKTGFPWERYTGVGSYKVSYIAFGYQQWGDLSMTSSTKTFPISFTNAYQIVGGVADSSYLKSFAPVYISVNSLTTTGFTNPDTTGIIGGKKTWIAFGVQQWGLISTSGGLTLQTITYSLSFGNTNYSVFLTPIWTANPGHADYTCASEHNSYHTVSGTKCYNYQEQKIRWLAIGI